MIYEHRVYNLMPGKTAEFVEAFGTIVPLFAKHGAKLIGAWQTYIGQNNEFIYILGFENLSAQEKFWSAFRGDEQFQKYIQSGVRTAYVVNKILRPAPYSPMQ